MTTIKTLGADATGTFLDDFMLVRDSRGNVYAKGMDNHTEVAVFDVAGKVVRRIGRQGQGPGEFDYVYRIAIGPGDSLYVQTRDRRVQVFAPSGLYVRSLRLPLIAHEMLVLPDSRLLARGSIGTPAAFGHPLHVVDVHGQLIRSFGGTGKIIRPDDWTATTRSIWLSRAGAILSASPNKYLVERWDTAGRTLGIFSPTVPWFEPWELPYESIDYQRPRPALNQATETEDATLVWTVLSVADTNWKRGIDHPRRERDGLLSLSDRDRYVDVLVEARDRSAGTLLASLRLGEGAIRLLDDGYAYWARQNVDGAISVQLIRLSLVRRSR